MQIYLCTCKFKIQLKTAWSSHRRLYSLLSDPLMSIDSSTIQSNSQRSPLKKSCSSSIQYMNSFPSRQRLILFSSILDATCIAVMLHQSVETTLSCNNRKKNSLGLYTIFFFRCRYFHPFFPLRFISSMIYFAQCMV